jgi:uroporphyrinogen decarboxylase
MNREMTHRERILAAIEHRETDRVPTDYWGVPEITDALMRHFGARDMVELARALDIDKIMTVEPTLKPGRRNMWDIEMKRVPIPDGAGWYDEPLRHPLAGLNTIDEIEAGYAWPTVDQYDYSTIKAQCARYRREGFAVEGGYISLTYFYEMIRGTEQMLLDFAQDEALAEHVLWRLNEFASEHSRRILESGDGLIDISQVTDDFGAQSGLIMSPAMIDRYLGGYYDQNIALVKSFGAHVFHHDDGAIMKAVPWIADKGCEVLNPLQWHLPGWDLYELKREYGNRLCFHGGIDNQEVLPFRDAESVRREVRACVDALYADRTGYILAPCHNIQAITPIGNILEMYRCAAEYSTMERG